MSDRKVHFSVPIHQIEYLGEQWETASRLARDGSGWLRMGLDRQRFQDRVERTGETLNRILDHDFRQKIYQERFENFVINDSQNTTAYTKPDESNIIEYNQPNTSLSGVDTDIVADLKQQQQSIQAQCPQQHRNQQNNRRRRSARKRNKNNRRRKHR